MKQHKQLSRRVLSVSLSAALALGMISPAALAAAPADTLYVSVSGSDANDGTQESPLATLPAAYDAVNDGGTIILLSDLETDIVTEFAEEKSVTLDGGGYSVTYTSSTSISTEAAGVFSVSAGTVSLTNITVQMPEQKGTNGRVLYIGEGGAVELLDGAVLANGYLGYGGGGVLVDGGSLTMTEGAEIQDCYIVNNTTGYGGGVCVADGGTFVMDGGLITGNTIHTTLGYENYGGGVAILAGATMTMTGGTITGNEVDTAGGGVYLAEGGTLELGGPAAINGNTVSSADNNLYLPTTGATWAQIEAATGEIGVTHGEADYNVIVGTPSGYTITRADEDAYTYDGGYGRAGHARTYCSFEEQRIVVRSGLSQVQTAKTVLHEITHAILHNEGDAKTRAEKELEAESAAFVICSHYGIDTSEYTFPYLASWCRQERDKLERCLDAIQKHAFSVIEQLDASMLELEKAKADRSSLQQRLELAQAQSAIDLTRNPPSQVRNMELER